LKNAEYYTIRRSVALAVSGSVAMSFAVF